MAKKTQVLFYNDPVRAVLPFLERIDEGKLSASDKATVYYKVAGTVDIKSMQEAVSMLVKYAKTSFPTVHTRDYLFDIVGDWFEEDSLKRSGKILSGQERVVQCVNTIRNTIGSEPHDLKDAKGQALCNVQPSDFELLAIKYSKIRYVLADEKKVTVK